MTSEERKQARYERRCKEREKKRQERKEKYDNFDNIANPDALLDSALKASKGIGWKTSVQRFNMNLANNVIKLSENLYMGGDIRKGFVTFTFMERGKVRLITSVHFSERVAQKSLTQNVLIPILTPSLIYDNGACIKGKGQSFAMDELIQHLHDFYNRTGSNEGYAVLLDLSNFFGSIPHDKLKERIAEYIDDENILALTFDFIDSFQGEVGLGLGSETCQIEAIFYPSPVDHVITDKLCVKEYARYMDDSYAIVETYEEAEKIRDTAIEEYKKLGLTVNEKKTKIVKLDSKDFKFLKNKVKLDENGAVVVRPNKKNFRRMKQKLKKFKIKYDNGEMTFNQINNSYQSWRGFMSRKDAYFEIKEMDDLFKEWFVVPERKRKAAENRKKQLEANPNSKRQIKKKIYMQKQEKLKENTISSENSIASEKKKEQPKDGNKKKKKAGRRRMTNNVKELKPDSRMTKEEVHELKTRVDNKKKTKTTLKNETVD